MNLETAWYLAAEAPELLGMLYRDRRAIGASAARRLASLLEAAAEVGFYAPLLAPHRDRIRRAPFEVLARLPAVRKADLRHAGHGALRGGRVDPTWRSTRSSGSTGEPFRVHYELRAWVVLKYLVKARARWYCGVRPWHRIAVVDAFPDAPAPAAPERWPVHRVNALLPTEEIAARLTRIQPHIIYGLPSTLLEAGTASRTTVCPRSVFTSGELLTARLRGRLEAAFGCRVYDIYGSTETKEVAWECRSGGWHVNADVLHVEIVDDDGQPVTEGTEGRILVTVLVNRAMPLLRYDTGDRGRLSPGECDCGLALPLLGILAGREAEYLDLGGGVRLSPYRLTCAVEKATGVGRYQVRQALPRCLVVRAVPLQGAEPGQVERDIQAAIGEAVTVPVRVEVQLVDRINHAKDGKFRVVVPLATEPLQGEL